MEADKRSGTSYWADNQLLSDAFKIFVEVNKEPYVTDGTLRTYRTTYKKIVETMPGLRMKDVFRNQMQQTFNQIADSGLKPITIKRFRFHLSEMFKEIILNGGAKVNPMEGVRVASVAVEYGLTDKVFSMQQYQMFVHALMNRPMDNKSAVYVILLTAALSGLRVGEVQALREDDVNRMHQLIRVDETYDRVSHLGKEPKTFSSRRQVKVPRRLLMKLDEYLRNRNVEMMKTGARNPENWLFVEIEGRQAKVPTISNINYYMHKVQTEVLKMPKDKQISTHSLRRTYASILLSKEGGGQSAEYVANVLGHSTTEMVRRVYGKLIAESAQKAADNVANMLDAL